MIPEPLSEMVFFFLRLEKNQEQRVSTVGLRITKCALAKFLSSLYGQVHHMQVIAGRMVLIGRTVSRATSARGSQFLEE